VFRDDMFIPWAARVNKFGEMDLLDDEGTPLYPFFYDVVCADEAQDFVSTALICSLTLTHTHYTTTTNLIAFAPHHVIILYRLRLTFFYLPRCLRKFDYSLSMHLSTWLRLTEL